MAPYMSETTSGNETLSIREEVKPSGIRVIIVGAGFAGLTAAIELSVFRLDRVIQECIADDILMNSSQRPYCYNLRVIQKHKCTTWRHYIIRIELWSYISPLAWCSRTTGTYLS